MRTAMMERLVEFLARRSRWPAVLCLCSLVFPAWWLRNARVDNSIEVWIGTRGKEYHTYKRFVETYGNEEFIALATEAHDPLAEPVLDWQRDLAQRLRKIEYVDGVLTIADAVPLVAQNDPDWKQRLQGNTLFHNLLLGADGQTLGLIVWLRKLDSPAERKTAVEQIEAALAETTPDTTNIHLAGTPLLNVALDRGSQQASQRFLPVALAVSVLVLGLMLRRLGGVIAVMGAVATTTVWTAGLMVLAGRTFNMVTVTLPSLLVILSLSGGIHLVSRFQSILTGPESAPAALRDALREVLPPVFVSNLTTAVGFGSLMVSDMQPVVDFGRFAAVGMLLSFVFTAVVVPGLLAWLHAGRVLPAQARRHWTVAIGRTVVARKAWMLSAAAVVGVVSLLLMMRVRVESNVLKFFPDNARVSRDYRFVADRLTGLYTIELDASTAAQNGSTLLKEISELGTRLLARPDVAQVIHYRNVATSLRDISPALAVASAGASQNPLKELARKYRRTRDGRVSLRMSILVRTMSSRDFYSLMDYVEKEADEVVRHADGRTLTGVVPLLNAAQRSLVDTQVRSFAIAAGVVLLLIGLFLRAVRAVAAAVLPNVLPILILFAVMGLLRIPLDAATIMIASMAIGIAVDDTIHFLSCFRREKQAGCDDLVAVGRTFEKAGRAITFTSVVSAAGFAILLLAAFKPIQYFGLLAGITMATAWAGDVFLLPVCAAWLRLWDRPETTR